MPSIVILGAGPAGLGAAWRLARRGGFDVSVVERQPVVGGNAGSFDFAGLPVDYGSHRLHPSCEPRILDDIRGMLGDGLLDRPRHGRIRLSGRWVHFPLKPLDLALHLPLSFSLGVARDAAAKLVERAPEDSFAAVLERGLGRTICRDFYFPYARKIWGAAPDELDPEQARRRVSAGSLGKMIRKVLGAVPGFKKPGGGRFYYPRDGFGAISKAFACGAMKAGAQIRLRTSVDQIALRDGRVSGVTVSAGGETTFLEARQTLSTIPITALVRAMRPEAPRTVLDAAAGLRFRSMILIYLALDAERFTEFDAHYFPGADIPITRLSEPKNYGLRRLPGRTVLCAELPCGRGDSVWSATDDQLADIVRQSLERAGLPLSARVVEVSAQRLPQAYPIYTRDYRERFDLMDRWVSSLDGVVTFGRQGLFAHDNTHHALAMAYALDRCLRDGGSLDRAQWARCRAEFQRHVVED
jgi:protoporphyrinogen oxidase